MLNEEKSAALQEAVSRQVCMGMQARRCRCCIATAGDAHVRVWGMLHVTVHVWGMAMLVWLYREVAG